ncbi:MAG: hypothetical protein RLY50_361 [Actinomycetota bacterium]|jgi:CO/xanthine dehydrogenase FAD-binding subunit
MPVHAPTTLREAAEILAEHPDAHLLTGGTDMMVEVNFNHRKPETVIALRQVRELTEWHIDSSAGRVVIGAGVPYADMEHGPLADALPALAEAARTVGSPQIRAAGTLGGNLGTCSPAGDSLPVLSAMDATIHLVSASGERAVPFSEFMTGPKRHSAAPDEIISAVSLPVARGPQGYAKVGVRNAMVISVASACLALEPGAPRLALGAVGPVIIRCHGAEAWLTSALSAPDALDTAEFGRMAAAESRPIDDHRSTAAYRRHAVAVLATRLLERGLAR